MICVLGVGDVGDHAGVDALQHRAGRRQPDAGLVDGGVRLALSTPPATLSTRNRPMTSTTTPVTTTVVAPTRSCSERRHVT